MRAREGGRWCYEQHRPLADGARRKRRKRKKRKRDRKRSEHAASAQTVNRERARVKTLAKIGAAEKGEADAFHFKRAADGLVKRSI